MSSVRRMFKRKKTDFLGKLTRHLLNEDEGEHWPVDLDFEMVSESRIELNLTPTAIRRLHESVAHIKRFRYSTLFPYDKALPSSLHTRVDGRTLVLVPYTRRLVALVHGWMQDLDMCRGMGVRHTPA